MFVKLVKEIRFKQDKNGKRIAQYWHPGAERWVKIEENNAARRLVGRVPSRGR
jgi:hypothetical protein